MLFFEYNLYTTFFFIRILKFFLIAIINLNQSLIFQKQSNNEEIISTEKSKTELTGIFLINIFII